MPNYAEKRGYGVRGRASTPPAYKEITIPAKRPTVLDKRRPHSFTFVNIDDDINVEYIREIVQLHERVLSTSKQLTLASTESSVYSQEIIDAIHHARRMLEWEDDWDDEGSPGYNEETWQRMRQFLLENVERLYHYNIAIATPEILPGPNGSMDIHWKLEDRELLINIPANDGELADFYGDNKVEQSVKGDLDLSADNQWLLMWLMQ